MKINWNNNYTTIGVYAFIVILLSLISYEFISEIDISLNAVSYLLTIFQPFIIGFVIAYLLNFILKFYEKKIFKHGAFKSLKKSAIRKIAILCSYLTAGLILYMFVQFVLPQLLESVSGLINDLPRYVKEFTAMIEKNIYSLNINDGFITFISEKLTEFVNWLMQFLTNLLPLVGNALFTFASSIWNVIIGLIISVYFLLEKERFLAINKKLVTALFNEKTSSLIIKLTKRTNFMFSKFISGQILDSAIIGVLIFIVLSIFKMPYVLFLSVLMGCTNVIPFFGPFIGAIPSAIIVLFTAPSQFLLFIVIILIIQQMDGNLIGPKILGDSIGVSPFWIIFSILTFGKLFGFIGMVVAVPLFGVIYSVVKELIEVRLTRKELPVETEKYMTH